MAKQSVAQFQVIITGDGLNEQYQMPAVINPAAPGGGPIATALSSGDNNITVPPGSVGALIIPSQSSSVVKKLKGITGDTGVTISPNSTTMMSFPSPAPATLLINAASGETISILWL